MFNRKTLLETQFSNINAYYEYENQADLIAFQEYYVSDYQIAVEIIKKKVVFHQMNNC